MTPRRSARAAAGSAARTPRSSAARKGKKGSRRLVYRFTEGHADGGRDDKELLGGKGANLAEMCRLGLPVPDGFTITTEVCTHFGQHKGAYPAELEGEVRAAMKQMERSLGKRFGDPSNPLLVAVRSGARASMPGMMDTVLNLGLNEKTTLGLAKRSGNPRFAWDAYRRFIQMYSDVVLEVRAAQGEHENPLTAELDRTKKRLKISEDTDLTPEDLRGLVTRYLKIVRERTGQAFPTDPVKQLWGAISAVFRSWDNERAVAYRAMHGIPGHWGTAVNVVAMVFGNTGERSGTGVAFTRDPATGEKRFYGEYLINAQGEDVVAGLRTPQPIEQLAKSLPKAFRELQRIQGLLERHYRDMQDLEFTIEDGRLFMLQCRSGKRTGPAAVRIAVDLVRERKITREEALLRVDPEAITQLLAPVFDGQELCDALGAGRRLTRGLNAGPGAATGRLAFDPKRAVEMAKGTKRGERNPVILARIETSPEDIRGMEASVGILTARGGMTSHAALVARQMGRVCVAGAGEVEIDYAKRKMRIGDTILKEGDWISLDGTTGEVYEGLVNTCPSEVLEHRLSQVGKKPKKKTKKTAKKKKSASKKEKLSPLVDAYVTLMGWADKTRSLKVRTNADQPDQCAQAIALGAEGIGLCRTEHMFFGANKIDAVREMILAEDDEGRKRALRKLLPLQRKDFEGIFEAMGSRPVTIRTLDPPLHEFLPHDEPTQRALAKDMGIPLARLKKKMDSLHESNPMLGHRGCRLGLTYPDITRMQAYAMFEAACSVAKRTGVKPMVEVMIPLVSTAAELEDQAAIVREVAEKVLSKNGVKLNYLVGTMIELPRAALVAGAIAECAEFFSFGTNDLTQTTYGISRDDSSKFVPGYIESEIFDGDPFATIDRAGVGRLMDFACREGRISRPDIKLGICGEHGGDPNSIDFCASLGLAYVSCSPFRVPVARLAAAQAALRQDAE